MLAAVIVTLIGEVIWRRPLVPRLCRHTLVLGAGLLGGIAVIGASAAIHGTLRSQGSFAGYIEFVVIVLLVLVLTILAPRLALYLLLATAGGALISDVLALTNVQGGQFGGTSRLIGGFGNPNYLACATSLGLAVIAGAWRFVPGRMRVVLLLAVPFMLTTLLLTYSRGGLIAAFAGAFAALVLAGGTPKARRTIFVSGVVVAAAALAGLYPAYQSLRLRSDYALQIVSGIADRSGWDPSAEGFINGSSELRNASPGVLQVTVQREFGGVSYPFGKALRGKLYELSLSLRTSEPNTHVRVGMEDNYAANGPVSKELVASTTWQELKQAWRPTADSRNARFYVWGIQRGAVLYLRNVAITAATANGGGGGPTSVTRGIGTRLLGAPTANQAFAGKEGDFLKSRIAAAQLSWKLFKQHPLFGVGWERYASYAGRELPPAINAGSPHDDYLRMAAELGIAGVLFLLTCLVALVMRFRRGRLCPAEQVAVGPLVAAGVILFFITGLESPAISLPMAAALGIVGASPRLLTSGAGGAWSGHGRGSVRTRAVWVGDQVRRVVEPVYTMTFRRAGRTVRMDPGR